MQVIGDFKMKFIRYSKFKGFDVFGVNLGDLMESLSESLLQSGFHEDYWYTRERFEQDDSYRRAAPGIAQCACLKKA